MQYLDYLTSKPAELSSYIKDKPLAYIPFGALEWHGEHNILGLDSVKAVHLCKKCAEITGGVLFPCVNWGAFDTMNFPFTFHFSKKALKKNTWKMMKQLYEMGFRVVVLLTGHYPGSQIKNVRRAAKKFTGKYHDGFALGVPEQAIIPDMDYYGDHAAQWETSIMMAIDPTYVDIERLPKGLSYSERAARLGVFGRDPIIHASKSLGEKAIHEIVSRLTAAVNEVLETQSAAPFNKIYANFRKAFKLLYDLGKLKVDFNKIFETQGMESMHELWNYVKWRLFRKAKQISDYTS